MSYSQQNTDLIEKARQASLADFFTQNGFETELSRNELHVKGYGGLYVNTETNEWYCFSQAEKHGGRNAINCLNRHYRNGFQIRRGSSVRCEHDIHGLSQRYSKAAAGERTCSSGACGQYAEGVCLPLSDATA